MSELETQMAEWRAFVGRDAAFSGLDVDELEAHLRDQMADLTRVGLSDDEAFLVAVKRMGGVDELSREYSREHSARLWKQLTLSGGDTPAETDRGWTEALAFAVAAAVAIQVARLASGLPDEGASWLARNAGLLVVPFLAGYFARRRRLSPRGVALTAIPFLVAAVLVNMYPFVAGGSTELLVATHLPVVLWFVVAYPYSGGDVRSHERRMDFVRFTGEWFIYYVLITNGGAVLLALTVFILEPAGVDAELIFGWVGVPGAAGAVIVAAWLVEYKQHVVENMAPVLTMIFTPLFAVMLAAAAAVYAFTGFGAAFDRDLLFVFDALLVVVLGLVLYDTSARDPATAPGWMDRIQLVAVGSALLLDGMLLGAMVGRISELGFTPNRAAALGLNLVLLACLVGTGWVSLRFLTGRGTFHRVERWQTGYLPVFALWAAVVVVVFPPLFAFI